MYYLRTRPAADPIKFTVDKTRITSNTKTDIGAEKGVEYKPEAAAINDEQMLARRMRQCDVTDENGACLMCSS